MIISTELVKDRVFDIDSHSVFINIKYNRDNKKYELYLEDLRLETPRTVITRFSNLDKAKSINMFINALAYSRKEGHIKFDKNGRIIENERIS